MTVDERKKVDALTRRLFPDEIHSGDCRKEVGREGRPCRICDDRNKAWSARLWQVYEALIAEEFSI